MPRRGRPGSRRNLLLHEPAYSIPVNECFLKGTRRLPERSLTPDLLFWFGVMEVAWFCLPFRAWRRFVARISPQCWPPRPQPAWLRCRGVHRRAARLDPSPMAGQGPPSAWCRASAPHCLPWAPGEMGDMLLAGSGPPRNPHPTFPLRPPVSRASGTGLRVQPFITATCRQPQHKPAKSKRLFCWAVRGGGECAGLMAAAPLTI